MAGRCHGRIIDVVDRNMSFFCNKNSEKKDFDLFFKIVVFFGEGHLQ